MFLNILYTIINNLSSDFIHFSKYFFLTNKYNICYNEYEVIICFGYKPLLKLLIDKNMTKTQLREQLGISMATLAKISKNEYISMKVLDDICSLLNCKIEDIVEHQP